MVGNNIVLFLVFVLIIFNVVQVPNDRMTENIINIEEFNDNARQYLGEQITIHGYLMPTGGDLILYEKEPPRSEDNRSIMIVDSSADQSLKGAYDFDKDTCTGRYVKVTGIVGIHPARKFLAIIRILTIEKYSDETYQNSEGYCYAVDRI